MLTLADNLKLPVDAVTEKIAFLGRTGTGKTYAAMKLAEQMLEARAQIIALDAVGKWYGLRVAGAGAGFTIPVFGGLNGDFPLEATGGKLLADLITDRAISAVLDVSQFTHAEQIRFALDFATHFYQRKKAAPSAVHVFLEECQEFVPQNPMPGEQAMLAAFERLWKLGRNFGIGGSLISQRPQEVNKKALNQTGTLFVFGMTGPQERKAIEQWVSAQGINEDIGALLPTLQRGQPHVWSPTFLRVSKTVRIEKKRTADVSATPTVSGRVKEKPLTPIDAAKIATAMAATIEKAKADDPRELRKTIAELQRQLKKSAPVEKVSAPVREKVIEQPALTDADRELLAKVGRSLEGMAAELGGRSGAFLGGLEHRLEQVVEGVMAEARKEGERVHEVGRQRFAQLLESKRFQKILDKLAAVKAVRPPTTARTVSSETTTRPSSVNRAVTPASTDGLTPAKQKILNGLAFLHGIGVPSADKTQLALIVGVSPTSGGYFNSLGSLRSGGFIEYPSGGLVALTGSGEAVASTNGVPTTTAELHEAIRTKLPPAKWKVLDALIAVYPNAVPKDALAEQIGVSPTSGGYFNTLGSLRSLGLIAYPRKSEVAALPVLFLEDRP